MEARNDPSLLPHLEIIRLATFSLGGSAYVNFMGNEFGHPERIEFPRSSNSYSYALARRQWDLLKDNGPHAQLAAFDQALMKLDNTVGILNQPPAELVCVDDEEKLLAFARGRLLFVLNFHFTRSHEAFSVPVEDAGEYEMLLNSDDQMFGGRGLLNGVAPSRNSSLERQNGVFQLELPVPSMSAQVYRLRRMARF
ncbi:hypothetical protein L7F22_001508 [Adiantum nelumboides]|nr:hypothetical protein [Adiantum nelumboides]